MAKCSFCYKDTEIECICTVDYDSNCNALTNPRTFDDYKKAYEHWSDHGYLAGCSHGC